MKILSTFRKAVVKIARRSPFLADCISGWKMYRHTKMYHEEEQNTFAEAFYRGKQPYVLSGVFKGMLYENRIYFGPVTPRWIGSYEKELSPVIKKVQEYNPERIVDIGAAEGYYSVGLARMFRSAQVISYETNPLSMWQQRVLKKLNKTNNLQIKRYCSQMALCNHGKYRSFILSDIEGSEYDLFSWEVVSCLKHALVLIELHAYKDLTVDSVASALHQRFASSHSVTYITPSRRSVGDIDISCPATFSEDSLVSAMNECRSQPQKWMYCVPTQ